MSIIVVDEGKRKPGMGSNFLRLIEKWLRALKVKSINAESRKEVWDFISKMVTQKYRLMIQKIMNLMQTIFLLVRLYE